MKVERVVAPPLAANCYIIGAVGVMIDAGGDAEFILRYLSGEGLLKKLKNLLLTHTHFDHAGAAYALRECGIKVSVHKDELTINYTPLFASVEADFILEGDEILNFRNLKLKVIHTPGHTPGSLCFYEPDRKWLFSGDTVFSYGGFGRVDFPGGDASKLIQSLKKLTELDVEVLYPGHDEVVEENANREIRKAYEIAKRLL